MFPVFVERRSAFNYRAAAMIIPGILCVAGGHLGRGVNL